MAASPLDVPLNMKAADSTMDCSSCDIMDENILLLTNRVLSTLKIMIKARVTSTAIFPESRGAIVNAFVVVSIDVIGGFAKPGANGKKMAELRFFSACRAKR